MKLRRLRIAAGLGSAGLIVFAGCAGDSEAGSAAPPWDSAGIRISECPAPAGTPTSWQIAPTPALTIADDRGAEYELSGVVDAARLGNGDIVVANARPPELRVYDSTGRFVRRIGREGSGPGEFRTISFVQVAAGDTLAVYDRRLRRLSFFDRDGRYSRMIAVSPHQRDTLPGLNWVAGLFADGSYVAFGDRGMSDRVGIVNLPRRVVRIWPARDSVAELGIFPGDDWRFVARPNGAIGFDNNPLFGRKSRVLLGPNRFFVANNSENAIRQYDLGGQLRGIRRVRRDPFRLSDSDVAWVIDSIRRTSPDASPATRQIWRDEITAFPTLPFYNEVVLDADENLWVREYDPPGKDHPFWSVFAADGSCAATVAGPAGLSVLEIGNEYLLGVVRGPLGEERVVLHPLSR